MKQQDIAVIIIIVFIAGIGSYFVSSKFITPSTDKESVEVVQPIVSEFTPPDSTVFNTEAINPTVRIKIGPNDNQTPFSSGDAADAEL